MSNDRAKSIIEALLFAGHEPIKPAEIREILARVENMTEGKVRAIVDELREGYLRESKSFTIAEIAGGYRLQTLPEYAEWISKLRTSPQRRRLSAPALETLAIIAYRQPITKAEIEAIRGVNIDGVLENLLDRELIETKGRKQAIGKPHLYAITKKFLEHFGLQDLKDLPQIDELKRTSGAEKSAREAGATQREAAPDVAEGPAQKHAKPTAAGTDSHAQREAEPDAARTSPQDQTQAATDVAGAGAQEPAEPNAVETAPHAQGDPEPDSTGASAQKQPEPDGAETAPQDQAQAASDFVGTSAQKQGEPNAAGTSPQAQGHAATDVEETAVLKQAAADVEEEAVPAKEQEEQKPLD
ncbi:MAG: SMC-Scp complex subunit ScpB [Candidatus Aureabacteria bacterium]|nr:SMC-Scp complex subunit ScpB [Candidatus Auribacterota bacterium]